MDSQKLKKKKARTHSRSNWQEVTLPLPAWERQRLFADWLNKYVKPIKEIKEENGTTHIY